MTLHISNTVVTHPADGDIEVKHYTDEESNDIIILSMGLVGDKHVPAQDIEHQLFIEVRELLLTKLTLVMEANIVIEGHSYKINWQRKLSINKIELKIISITGSDETMQYEELDTASKTKALRIVTNHFNNITL